MTTRTPPPGAGASEARDERLARLDANSNAARAFQEAMPELVSIDPATELNDFSNAERLARVLCDGPAARYVNGRGWFRWAGTRYAPADDWVINAAADEVRKLFAIAAKIPGDKDRLAVLRHANASLKRDRLAAMIALASSIAGVKIQPAECDANPYLLGVRNGIVSLEIGKISTYWRAAEPFELDFVTLQASANFDAEATCPRWEQFLREIFPGDVDLVDYVQRVVGYALSGDMSEHALFFLYGSGANGKSVFVNVLKALFGEYAAVISSETLLARRHGQQTNDLARLPGKRLVIASELEDGVRWNESLVKSLTGGDPISARFLYAEWFEFTPIFKLFVVGNHRPIVRGADEGIWRRLQLIPFNVFFPPEKRDHELTARLCAELPGILNWALEGFRCWRLKRLAPPAGVVEATAAYRAEEDRIGQFLEERCELQPEFSVRTAALYKAYRAWAEARGETAIGMNRFTNRLAERGIGRIKNSVMYFRGLGLKAADDAPPPPVPPV